MTVRVIRKYDIRPVDFDSGKRLAIPREQMEECQCCGKKIVIINELSNGHHLGSECAAIIPHNRGELKIFGLSKKQLSYFFSIR
jgi:hypothetical protein